MDETFVTAHPRRVHSVCLHFICIWGNGYAFAIYTHFGDQHTSISHHKQSVILVHRKSIFSRVSDNAQHQFLRSSAFAMVYRPIKHCLGERLCFHCNCTDLACDVHYLMPFVHSIHTGLAWHRRSNRRDNRFDVIVVIHWLL